MSCRTVEHIDGLVPPGMLPHEDMVVCRMEKSNGTTAVLMWCPRCQTQTGEISKGLIGGPESVSRLPLLFDLKAGCRTARQRKYDDYRKTREWLDKRDMVILRSGGFCEGCGKQTREWEVHHLTYDHLGSEVPGGEFLWELKAVCSPCHDRVGGYALPEGV